MGRTGLALVGALTVAAIAITAIVTAAGARATAGAGGAATLQVLGRAVMVGVPLAVALYAWRRPAHARFGWLLLLVGGLWFLAALSNSSSPLLFSIGRVSGWLAETGLIYAVLAFPGGQLTHRREWALVTISIALVAALYLPTALLVSSFPAPSAWSSCSARCPHNAFMVLSHQPGWISSFIYPLRELLTVVVFLIVAAWLAARIRRANALTRRIVEPVLVVAIARLVVYVAALGARRVWPHSPVIEVLTWALAFGVPALALAFLVGLVRWHLFVTGGIRSVNAHIREARGPEQVRELLAESFDDPGLQIASWSSPRRRWIGADGNPLDRPGPQSGLALTEVRDGRQRVVAIRHDVVLRADSAFVEAAAAAASVGFASDRVAARTAGMIRELRASRSRILAAADDERRRIERDLHDGAQQRLVGLCVHLELAAERAEPEHPDEAAALRELGVEVEEALEEIRSLTRGIYPGLLIERGLDVAVRSAAQRSTVSTTVAVDGLSDYPLEITTAVYFCCVEALQNVAKHAPGAQSVRIVLRDSGSVLSFSVSDDGPGLTGQNARVGAGMLNMRDRMTTIGGQLTVHSQPGQGTRVSGRVPLAAMDPGTTTADLHPSSRGHVARRRNRSMT